MEKKTSFIDRMREKEERERIEREIAEDLAIVERINAKEFLDQP